MTQGGAAAILWQNWQQRTRIDELPPDCRPADRAAGYAAQLEIVRLSGQPVVGWKIAATSAAGQKHIGVDGPLAGPLLAHRVLASGATVPLDGNVMKVAEAEFAFKFRIDLPQRPNPYGLEEVLAAVESLHPAIEVPDSRYNDFARVGALSSSPTPHARAGSCSAPLPPSSGAPAISPLIRSPSTAMATAPLRAAEQMCWATLASR
jgi:2-keto-4-pentenoate hydratase